MYADTEANSKEIIIANFYKMKKKENQSDQPDSNQ